MPDFLIALRHRGGVVNSIIAIAAAKGLIQSSSDPDLQRIKINTSWAQSFTLLLDNLIKTSTWKKRNHHSILTWKLWFPEKEIALIKNLLKTIINILFCAANQFFESEWTIRPTYFFMKPQHLISSLFQFNLERDTYSSI